MDDINKWADIAENYTEAVLLGNGASIAVDGRFSYPSLFAAAKSLTHITKDVQDIFDIFRTNDFEVVLRELWHAHMVTTALGVPVKEVEDAYNNVRDALIKTIRDVHIDHANLTLVVSNIYQYMQNFHTVISLNYDLIVYWSMLHANDALRCKWFKDAFTECGGRKLRVDINDLRNPYRAAAGATLVFYPHGNLVLAEETFSGEVKLQAGRVKNLLEEIIDSWLSGSYTPVFVSEGDPTKKKIAIDRSHYLSRVYYEFLPALGDTLAIYGWGLSEQDNHILSQISKNNFSSVAVSVLVSGKTRKEIDDYCTHVTNRLNSVGITTIDFYDASSLGCWIH